MSSENSDKKLFLLDAYALIYRAHYAFINRPITNSKGQNTSSIYGFMNTLLDVLKNQNPSHIAVAFDPPTSTFRHDTFPQYKAQRPETPEDIKFGVPYIKELIGALNIPIIQIDKYEADDAIGALAKKAEKKGFKVFMMTPDKDYAQLVSENIFMYKPGRSGNEAEVWGVKEVCEAFEIEDPLQVIEILALWGDSSDNIPGAPGIGEKTAKELIKLYKTVNGIYQNLDKLKGKQKLNLIDFKDQVMLSRHLVTIALDVPVELDEDLLKTKEWDKEKLAQLLDKLEFKNIKTRLFGNIEIKPTTLTSPSAQPSTSGFQQGSLFGDEHFDNTLMQSHSSLMTIRDVDHTYKTVQQPEEISALIKLLLSKPAICFDTETTGLDVLNAHLVGISFSVKAHEAFYIPIPEAPQSAQVLLEQFRPIFENESILKVGQNMKFDIQVLRNYNMAVKGPLFDTMVGHYLLQPELRHNMDVLAANYLNYKPIPIEELIGKKGASQKNMRHVPVETISEYAAEDADITWQLYEIIAKEIQQSGLSSLLGELEMPLIPVLSSMELEGISINTNALNNYAQELKFQITNIENDIYHLAGYNFNIASPKQLGELLFERLKIDAGNKKTKTQQYSTSEETLSELEGKHPIVGKVLKYRTLSKLLSTYVATLPELVNPKTGKIHSSFNQTIAATGRLSSSNPNLQNIPIREEEGREIRKAFIASGDDFVLLSADYSQIELRLMAHMSEDAMMIEAFHSGQDIHASTASKIYNIPLDQVKKEQRNAAKTANFGIIYGISSFGLSQRMGILRTEAKDLIEGYFRTFPGVKSYMERCVQIAREKGYVETLYKRKRYLKDINSRNQMAKGFAERNAINAPIQGSAADLIKIAMIHIHKELERNHLKSKMILQVHDELVFNVYKPELNEVKELVKRNMEQVMVLKVPLIVETGVGQNWLEAH